MSRAIVILTLLALAGPASAQQQPRMAMDCKAVQKDCPAIGLRDPVGIGFSIGAPTAMWTDVRIAQWQNGRLEVEGSYGAGIASWGMGEGHSADFRVDLHVSDDNVNDGFVISPRAGYCEIVGNQSRAKGWFALDFSPYATVGAISLSCGLGWVHEYESWSLETSLVPGGAFAVSGIDNGNNAAAGQFSFQLFLKCASRF